MLQATQIQSNPFADAPVVARPNGNSAVAESDQQRAITEVQAAMVIAKRFPRNQVEAFDRVMQACTRPTLAESSLYEYNRGGSAITGPSIRLAEAIAQAWGNIQFGIRELSQSNGESTVEAFAWDVETNTRQTKVFQVPHMRYTKKGAYRLEDPRDIYEMVANQGARRLRACILGVIPGDVIEAATKQCETTLATKVELTEERVKKMLETFAGWNVTQEMIEARIQRRIDAITPALFMQLGKIANSIKDGMSKPVDWFDMELAPKAETQTNKVTEAVKEKLRNDKATNDPAKQGSGSEVKQETANGTEKQESDISNEQPSPQQDNKEAVPHFLEKNAAQNKAPEPTAQTESGYVVFSADGAVIADGLSLVQAAAAINAQRQTFRVQSTLDAFNRGNAEVIAAAKAAGML